MSLQNMAEEIMLRKAGKSIKTMNNRPKYKVTPFMTRQKAIINSSKNDEDNSSDVHVPRDATTNVLFEDDTFISNDDL
jgi:hypothetical protein